MKKAMLVLFSMLIVGMTVSAVNAKVVATTPETAAAIKLYKAGDYTQAYTKLAKITGKEPENALAHYYMAMTCVQLGLKSEALSNYGSVMTLSPNGVLGSYAKKGRKCVEDPARCHEPDIKKSDIGDTAEDKFIKGAFGTGFSEQARGMYEKQKIENLKREINRRDEVEIQKFKEYKDFSTQAPTNDEIVAALRTLQRAGLSDTYGLRSNTDLSMITGRQYDNNANYDILNLLYGANKSGSANLNPQVIQSLLTTQMTTSF